MDAVSRDDPTTVLLASSAEVSALAAALTRGAPATDGDHPATPFAGTPSLAETRRPADVRTPASDTATDDTTVLAPTGEAATDQIAVHAPASEETTVLVPAGDAATDRTTGAAPTGDATAEGDDEDPLATGEDTTTVLHPDRARPAEASGEPAETPVIRDDPTTVIALGAGAPGDAPLTDDPTTVIRLGAATPDAHRADAPLAEDPTTVIRTGMSDGSAADSAAQDGPTTVIRLGATTPGDDRLAAAEGDETMAFRAAADAGDDPTTELRTGTSGGPAADSAAQDGPTTVIRLGATTPEDDRFAASGDDVTSAFRTAADAGDDPTTVIRTGMSGGPAADSAAGDDPTTVIRLGVVAPGDDRLAGVGGEETSAFQARVADAGDDPTTVIRTGMPGTPVVGDDPTTVIRLGGSASGDDRFVESGDDPAAVQAAADADPTTMIVLPERAAPGALSDDPTTLIVTTAGSGRPAAPAGERTGVPGGRGLRETDQPEDSAGETIRLPTRSRAAGHEPGTDEFASGETARLPRPGEGPFAVPAQRYPTGGPARVLPAQRREVPADDSEQTVLLPAVDSARRTIRHSGSVVDENEEPTIQIGAPGTGRRLPKQPTGEIPAVIQASFELLDQTRARLDGREQPAADDQPASPLAAGGAPAWVREVSRIPARPPHQSRGHHDGPGNGGSDARSTGTGGTPAAAGSDETTDLAALRDPHAIAAASSLALSTWDDDHASGATGDDPTVPVPTGPGEEPALRAAGDDPASSVGVEPVIDPDPAGSDDTTQPVGGEANKAPDSAGSDDTTRAVETDAERAELVDAGELENTDAEISAGSVADPDPAAEAGVAAVAAPTGEGEEPDSAAGTGETRPDADLDQSDAAELDQSDAAELDQSDAAELDASDAAELDASDAAEQDTETAETAGERAEVRDTDEPVAGTDAPRTSAETGVATTAAGAVDGTQPVTDEPATPEAAAEAPISADEPARAADEPPAGGPAVDQPADDELPATGQAAAGQTDDQATTGDESGVAVEATSVPASDDAVAAAEITAALTGTRPPAGDPAADRPATADAGNADEPAIECTGTVAGHSPTATTAPGNDGEPGKDGEPGNDGGTVWDDTHRPPSGNGFRATEPSSTSATGPARTEGVSPALGPYPQVDLGFDDPEATAGVPVRSVAAVPASGGDPPRVSGGVLVPTHGVPTEGETQRVSGAYPAVTRATGSYPVVGSGAYPAVGGNSGSYPVVHTNPAPGAPHLALTSATGAQPVVTGVDEQGRAVGAAQVAPPPRKFVGTAAPARAAKLGAAGPMHRGDKLVVLLVVVVAAIVILGVAYTVAVASRPATGERVLLPPIPSQGLGLDPSLDASAGAGASPGGTGVPGVVPSGAAAAPGASAGASAGVPRSPAPGPSGSAPAAGPGASTSPRTESGSTGGTVGPLQASYARAANTGLLGLTGYRGKVTITNEGTAAASGWELTLSLPPGLKVTAADGAEFSQRGTLVRFSPSGGDTVPAEGSVSFTFDVPGLLAGEPTGCEIDGRPCQ